MIARFFAMNESYAFQECTYEQYNDGLTPNSPNNKFRINSHGMVEIECANIGLSDVAEINRTLRNAWQTME